MSRNWVGQGCYDFTVRILKGLSLNNGCFGNNSETSSKVPGCPLANYSYIIYINKISINK